MELSSLPRLVPLWWHFTGYQYVCAGILFYVKVFVIGFGIFFSRNFTVWFHVFGLGVRWLQDRVFSHGWLFGSSGWNIVDCLADLVVIPWLA